MGTALKIGAVAMILSHNHPSGNLKSSRADDDLTAKIVQACRFFDMRLSDHIIITSEGYYSYADDGNL
jgi:DNA repair protein RadC